MTYINVGANVNGNVPIKTKASLRLLMVTMPEIVSFYGTSEMGPYGKSVFMGDNLPKGYKLQVVGPDPYTKRVWYATVMDNGKVS